MKIKIKQSKWVKKLFTAFKEKYEKKFHKMMKKKLGLITDEADDVILIQELLDTMEKNKLDYTNTFRDLMNDKINNETLKIFKNKWKIRIDKQNRSHEEVLNFDEKC